jgi:hypothetical protein
MRSWVLLAVALPACLAADPTTDELSQNVRVKDKKCKPHKKHQDCGSVTAPIDVAGGTFTADNGLTVTVPYGAVDSPTTVTVTTTDIVAPGATSPVYEFGPEGTVFAAPLTITLPLPAGAATGTVYWSKLGSTTEYDAIGGTIDAAAGTITAETFHFSLGYVGQPSGDRTVSGGGSRTYISASSRENILMDFATENYDAIVGDGSGGYARLCGTPAGAGTFTIANVPNGDYILRNGTNYLVTSSNAPDLGFLIGGRPNRTPLTQTTQLDLTVTNLDAWDPGTDEEPADQIEWFSTEADDWDFNTERLAPDILPGDQSAFLPIDVANVDAGPASEIHSAEGYRAAVGQLTLEHTAAPASVPYLAMTRVAQFPSNFDVIDGSSQALSLALQPVPTSNTLSVDFRVSAWRAALEQYGNPHHRPVVPECNPAFCGSFVGALAQAYSANDGFYSANADLLIMFDKAGQDIQSGPMVYADPTGLGGQWGVLYDVRSSQRNIIQLPDTSGRAGVGTIPFTDSIEWTTTKAALEAGPILPPLLPPANLTINGQSFFDGGGDLNGVATIAWTNPNTTIQPAFYTISVIELYVDADNFSHGVRRATINTTNTSFTFPTAPSSSVGCGSTQPAAPILEPGHAYVFVVTATGSTSGVQADVDRLASAPFKDTLNVARATVTSGLFGNVHGTPLAELVQDGQSYPLGTAASASNVFWLERGQAPWDPPTVRNAGNLWMANLDGTDPRIIASGLDLPFELVVSNNTLYWANQGDGSDSTVVSLDLATIDPNSTTNAPTVVASEPGVGDILAFGGDVYWISAAGTTRLSGGVLSSVNPFNGVNFDTDGVSFYYAQYGDSPPNATGTIQSVPFAGGPASTLVSGQPQAWDVHTDGTYVYWSNQAWEQEGLATINRIPVMGGSPQTLTTGNELMKYFTLDANNLYFVRDGFVYALPKSGGAEVVLAAVPTFGCVQADLTISAGALYFTDTCGMATYRVALP